MTVAIIGSISLHIYDSGRYIPNGTSEIVSGGAQGALCAGAGAGVYVNKMVKQGKELPSLHLFVLNLH